METTEHQDHLYTNNEDDDSIPVDFTYKMKREEVEQFVKLRASNDHLFSGKRYASMWAWSAILKHMGLQCKMSHYQASKKWENLKKRYKELKYPPEGVTECPKTWFLFSLMDDALHDRLQGKAPILTAPNDCSNGDFLPRCRPRKRRAPVTEISLANDLIAGGPEIEITLSGDEDGEEAVTLEGSGLTKGCTLEVFDKEDGRNNDSHKMDRERALWRREKAVLDRELAALERARALLDREKATLERERAIIERERALMEKEKVILEKERDVVHNERVALEKEKASLNRTSTEPARTEEGTGSSGAVNSETTDRKKQLLYLFEKFLEGI
uniref:Si:dkeyp-38g8.5 n=1 Tax=Oryzias latipes TaxID=8090 RepID=A0A3P9HU33_ORYLA